MVISSYMMLYHDDDDDSSLIMNYYINIVILIVLWLLLLLLSLSLLWFYIQWLWLYIQWLWLSSLCVSWHVQWCSFPPGPPYYSQGWGPRSCTPFAWDSTWAASPGYPWMPWRIETMAPLKWNEKIRKKNIAIENPLWTNGGFMGHCRSLIISTNSGCQGCRKTFQMF